MTQKIVNGFPQFFSYTYLSGKFFGSPLTQLNQDYTDINLQSGLVGDSITLTEDEVNLIQIVRDGATILDDQGWDFLTSNTIRIWPGLLETEVVQVKKLVGASGVVETIPSLPPAPGGSGYPHIINEATVYTDAFKVAVNAFEAIVLAGKTRISTHFPLDEGRVDVYINSSRVSINDGIWSLADETTIELNDDYSTVRMKIDIIKQKVG